MIFAEASNTQAYLKAGIMGFAGSGKTYTASTIAAGLWALMKEKGLPGAQAPVYFLDTETGSDWVEPMFRKQGIKLFTAKTRAFVDLRPAILEVERHNGILLLDSITHFWRELTESYAEKKRRTRGLEFQDWAWLKKTWGEFTDQFINSNCHILMCGRAGYEYDFFTNESGKRELEKTGIKMKAETETGYEPSLLVLMEREQDISGDVVKVTRTATILKDRSTLLDGKRFANPTFADFLPHINFLNLGGAQLGVDTTHSSEGMIADDDGRREYLRQRDITLDEIKELLVKHFPGSGAKDKKAKGDALEAASGTRSWERLGTYQLEELRTAYAKLPGCIVGTLAGNQVEDEPDFKHREPETAPF